MKILHIGKFYPPFHGGMENYLCDLAESQTKQGHQVTAWVHNHEWQQLTSATFEGSPKGVKVIRQGSLKPILFTPIMLGFNQQLNKLIENEVPDIIHIHWPNPSLFKLLLNKKARTIPWVMSWHSDMVTDKSRWMMKLIYSFIKPLESKLIKQVEQILVSTQSYADHSVQLRKHSSKVSVLPLGIDSNKLKQSDGELVNDLWLPDKFRLLHIGRLTFYKNQSMLIEAMSHLQMAQLQIVGQGQLAAQLEKNIHKRGLDNVNLLGGLSWSSMNNYFKSCDVFCMASNDRAESFGVVLIEAMYHDKIILVPDTEGSGMKWLADNYNKGYVYQVDNSKDFIAKIEHIKENLNEIKKRPLDFNYSIDGVALKIQSIYQKIIRRSTQ